MNKTLLKNRQDKIGFLSGLVKGTRSISEIVDLHTVFTDLMKLERAKADPRYKDQHLFYIPDNGRQRKES